MRGLVAAEQRPSGPERALLSAAMAADAPQLRALLQAGVSVDASDASGRTALMLAAERGHLAAMRLLVEAGADVDAVCRRKPGWTALMSALHADQGSAALALLAWGADPRACQDSGYSALMIAAGRGDHRAVEALVECGADAAAETFLGFTALDYAIGYGHSAIVRLLLSVAPQLRDCAHPARRTVVALASREDDDEILALLA